MSNPVPAIYDSICDSCGDKIEEGYDLFFHDGNSLCLDCAVDEDLVCECGNYKKPEYQTCFDCK